VKGNEHWWWRLELMLSTFRTACQTYLIPGIEVAIDEIMVRFFGRSHDTCKMPNKPIKQGYKIFALANSSYVWYFQLSLKEHGISELEKVDGLTPTGSMVLQMAQLLPKFPNAYYVLYMDNYFTSIPLFSALRKENIGAVGTTRASGTDFPALLIVLRKNWPTKLRWGTTIAAIVNDVLCIGWQDNNFVLGLSTIHTVHKASSFVNSTRNRPSKTSTNACVTRNVFGDLPFTILIILKFIDDYNHHMNSVDLANQLR
jgi:Transposase IS4